MTTRINSVADMGGVSDAMNGAIGLNILGDRAFDHDALVDLVRRLHPAYCVVLNNPALAAQLATYTHPIVRRTPDDSAPDHFDPIDFVRTRAPEIPPNGYLYLGNEPKASKKLNDWTVTALYAAHDLSVRCCILNLATGNPEPDEWESIAECIRLNNQYGGLNGVHAYWMNLPLQPPSYPYHTGRFFDVLERFDGRWVVTEAGANKDKGGGIPDGWAGWLTFRNEFDYANDFAAITPLWAGKNVALCTFSYPEWDGHGFDVSRATAQLQPRWVMLNQQYTIKETIPMPDPIPAPTIGGVKATLTAIPGDYINVRARPNGADAGDLLKGDVVTVYLDAPADGWVYQTPIEPVARPTGRQNAAPGWVSLQGGAVVFTKVVEPPPVEPPPVTHPTPSEVAAALEALNGAKADNTAVGVQIDNAIALIKGELLPAAPNTVTLDIPFVSQLGSEADVSPNDCGIAALLMLTRYAQKSDHWGVPDVPTVDMLVPLTPLGNNPKNLMTFSDVIALARRLGYKAEYRSGMTPDKIRDSIRADRPVMCLVDYSIFNLKGAKISHFMVASGFHNDEFICQDSYLQGANVHLDSARLSDAMKIVPGNAGEYQALVLVR